MRVHLGAAGVAVAVCVALGLLLVSTATSARPAASKRQLTAVREVGQRAKVVRGFDGDQAVGRITNLTPYTLTYVGSGTNVNPDCTVCGRYWVSDFPAKLEPGQDFVYRLNPKVSYGTTRRYDGWFTYRADTLNHTEYLSVNLFGSHCWLLCLPSDGPALGTTDTGVSTVWNGTSPPRTVTRKDFGPATQNPEIGWTASGNANVWPNINPPFDFTFQTRGNYTLDASKSPPHLADLLNAMCAGTTGTSCKFTTTGAIQWGIGDLDQQTSVKSCGAAPPAGRQRVAANPPADSPDWHDVSVEARRTRSVSFGGSLTGSTEVKLFSVIDTEVSVKIGAEHEWADTRTFEKTTRVYVPQNWVAGVWVAPVVGKVTGTLIVSTALASYTITNFQETASGVSKDLTTPAFDIMTESRPMTAAEYQRLCASQRLSAPPRTRPWGQAPNRRSTQAPSRRSAPAPVAVTGRRR